MLAADIAAAAEVLDQARLRRSQIEALPETCTPSDLAEGYAIQAALIGLRGSAIAGWKVGCISKEAQMRAGTNEPFSGPIFEEDIVASGCVIRRDASSLRALQAEFAFRLGRNLLAHEAPFTEEQICAAVAGVRAAIEIADSRFLDWSVVGAPNLIADAGKAGLMVLGERELPYAEADLVSQDVTLSVNGRRVARGTGRNVMGNPLKSLHWLANSKAARQESLLVGQLVSAGTCTGSYPAAPGDEVVATFGALGNIEFHFES